MHDQHPSLSFVDLNRSGIPLMEIVSKPDMRDWEEAGAYLRKLRSIVRYIGSCDGNMDQGSLRCDANISVRKPGEEFGTRCELKNINSVKFMMKAVEYEAYRQIEIIENGGEVKQETRLYDPNKNETRSMRSKEEANDYRYFPEPDLVLLNPDRGWINEIAAAMPELPARQREKLVALAGVDMETAATVVSKGLARLVSNAVALGANAGRAINHAVQNLAIDGADKLDPAHFAELIEMEQVGALTATQSKQILAEMVESGLDPTSIAQKHGFESMDSTELEKMVDAAIAENPDAWEKFCEGEEKVQGVFVGAVMKASKGQADGKAVSSILRQRRG